MTEPVWTGKAAEKAKRYSELKDLATIWCERQTRPDFVNTVECEVIEHCEPHYLSVKF